MARNSRCAVKRPWARKSPPPKRTPSVWKSSERKSRSRWMRTSSRVRFVPEASSAAATAVPPGLLGSSGRGSGGVGTAGSPAALMGAARRSARRRAAARTLPPRREAAGEEDEPDDERAQGEHQRGAAAQEHRVEARRALGLGRLVEAGRHAGGEPHGGEGVGED